MLYQPSGDAARLPIPFHDIRQCRCIDQALLGHACWQVCVAKRRDAVGRERDTRETEVTQRVVDELALLRLQVGVLRVLDALVGRALAFEAPARPANMLSQASSAAT